MKEDSKVRVQTPVSSCNSYCEHELFCNNTLEDTILRQFPQCFMEHIRSEEVFLCYQLSFLPIFVPRKIYFV